MGSWRRRLSDEERQSRSEANKAYWTPERRKEASEMAKRDYMRRQAEQAEDDLPANNEHYEAWYRRVVLKQGRPEQQTQEPKEEAMATERPTVQWDWSVVRMSGGSLSTQGEVEELIEVLTWLAERLPPGIDSALKKSRKSRKGNSEEEEDRAPTQ